MEKRFKGGEIWFRVNDYFCIDFFFIVINFFENFEWEFRVMVVNVVGNSEFSLCLLFYKIKEKIGIWLYI